jgi:uncharacterized membrane protein
MIEPSVLALTFLSALGSGLMAGLYFAFSAFVMTALGRIRRQEAFLPCSLSMSRN